MQQHIGQTETIHFLDCVTDNSTEYQKVSIVFAGSRGLQHHHENETKKIFRVLIQGGYPIKHFEKLSFSYRVISRFK